jgi:ABC-type lipoprotein release transport system permease subunit
MFSTLLRLAWRNLGRHLRRSLITGSALAFGISLCVATYGLIDGLNIQMLDALTGLDLGHVQIHAKSYVEKRRIERTVDEGEALATLVRADEDVSGAAARVYGFALIGAGDKSSGVQIVGIDSKHETAVTRLHKRMTSGTYLDEAPTPWPAGRLLDVKEQAADETMTKRAEQDALAEIDELDPLNGSDPEKTKKDSPVSPAGTPGKNNSSRELARTLSPPPERPPRIILGASLAKVLAVKPKQKVFLTTQGEVAGIYKTGTQAYDRQRIYMHLSDSQRLLHLKKRVHEVALHLPDPTMADAVTARLLPSQAKQERTVRAWYTIRPDIQKLLQLNDLSTGITVFIIFIVATLGVVNTMLMAVFERTRELGMLRAIGMSSRRIISLILTESFLLVTLASLVGTAIGLWLDWQLVEHGLDLRNYTEGFSIGGLGIEPVIYGAITLRGVLVPTLVLSTCCVLASLYPATRAARLKPAIGMRET